MSEWWRGWWQMKTIPRYGTLAAVASALLMLGWLVWLRPERQALATQQQKLQQLTSQLQLRQRQWHQNPSDALLQAQFLTQAAPVTAATSVQAVETVLASRRGQLEQWQPDARPRSLTLHLPWQAFQPLFTELAQAAVPFPARFRVLAQPQHLVVQLWLEPDDAP
ncbi:HofO family protein [Pantoea sp. S-LA4]